MRERAPAVAAARDADDVFWAEFRARAGARFALSRATAAHTPFLRALLAETLAESTRRSGGDPVLLTSGPLLEVQFQGQSRAYASAYPEASHYIVSRSSDAAPIGRMLIDWTPPGATQGVDLAILPEARAGAPGLLLLRAWLGTCDRLGRAARLHVTPDNPARRLYRRLGFIEVDATAFPIPMLREPRGKVTSD